MDQFVEPVLHGQKFRCEKQVRCSWTRDRIFDELANSNRIHPEHENAIGKKDSLVKVMCDEENGDIYFLPNLQQVSLHLCASERIERTEWLVHYENSWFIG
jgi:hypothetical protein